MKRQIKNRIRTNNLRTVRNSIPRFLSLVVMSLLGVFAFSGLMATAPDMITTIDQYLDDSRGYDLKVISDLGLTEEDVDAVRSSPSILYADGGRSLDTLAHVNGIETVLRIASMPNEVNQLTLLDGHFPEKQDEIVVEENFLKKLHANLGDKVLVDQEQFRKKELTVCGTVDSSLYYNSVKTGQSRGNTSVGNGKVNYYAFCLLENFDMDYYTVLYAVADGTSDLVTSEEPYLWKMEQVTSEMETLAPKREKARYEGLWQQGFDEIEERREEADQELNEAWQKLEDGRKELDDGKEKLAEGKAELLDAENQLSDARKQLEQGKRELEENGQKLKDSEAILSSAQSTLSASKEELASYETELKAAENELKASYELLEQSEQAMADGKAEIESKEAELASGKEQLDAAKTELDAAREELSLAEQELARYGRILDRAANGLKEARNLYQQTLQQYGISEELLEEILLLPEEDRKEYSTGIRVLAAAKRVLEISEDSFQTAQTQYQAKMDEYEQGQALFQEKEAEYEAGLSAYEEGLALLEAGKSELEQKEEELAAGKKAYEAGKALYEEQYALFVQGKQQYEEGLAEYQAGLLTYESGKEAYQAGKKQYEEGLLAYEEGLTEYEDGKLEYEEKQKEYLEAEQTYSDGMQEYQDAKQEVEEQLSDAMEELNSLEKPNWYIQDRTSYDTYNSYIDDANSIRALSALFPVVFFAVAVLVSLISMNRMVEEDRLEIGTLKSLGFSDSMIISKYLTFSLAATVTGGLLGAGMGLVIIPELIYNIYRILFALPPLVLTLQPMSTLLGFLITVVCVCGTSLFTAIEVLKEKPSELMRPKAPKMGQRILLERIGFFWKRLTFSRKVTIRNLFRYKKRVLVTIGGIAGCTALMLTGFGIRDSIMDLAAWQYEKIYQFSGTVYVRNLPEDNRFDQVEGIHNVNLVEQLSATLGLEECNLFIAESDQDLLEICNISDLETGEKVVLNKNSVVLTEKLAANQGISKGDTISFTDVDGQNYQFVVSNIVKNYIQHYIYMSKAAYESYGREFCPNVVYFDTELAEEERDALTQSLLDQEGVLTVSYKESFIENVSKMLNSLNSVVWILIVLSAMLSFVVLYNLANININERKREIATLKVLGFYDREVDSYITREMVLLTALGIALGLFFGIFLSRAVVASVEISYCRFINEIKPISYVYSAILSACFTAIVTAITHFNLKNIKMIESLKSVE